MRGLLRLFQSSLTTEMYQSTKPLLKDREAKERAEQALQDSLQKLLALYECSSKKIAPAPNTVTDAEASVV